MPVKKRIKDLAATAVTPAGDDFFAIDGATNKTRKMLASSLLTESKRGAADGLASLGANSKHVPAEIPPIGFHDYRTEAFTAANGGKYICSGTFAITNPGSGAAGQAYQVIVLSGAITINGVAFAPSRFPILVAHNGSAWQTLPQTITGDLALPGATFGSNNALSGALGDARYGIIHSKTKSSEQRETTTFSPDSDLQVASVQSGIYNVRLRFQAFNNNNGGLKWRLNGTATFSSIGRAISIRTGISPTSISDGIVGGEAHAEWFNATRIWLVEGSISVTAGGSIAWEWAQDSTGSPGTTVGSGALELVRNN